LIVVVGYYAFCQLFCCVHSPSPCCDQLFIISNHTQIVAAFSDAEKVINS
jgi:hypothetical protein